MIVDVCPECGGSRVPQPRNLFGEPERLTHDCKRCHQQYYKNNKTMSEEEYKEMLESQNGIILAWKDGDSVYPIPIEREDADVLKFFLSKMNNDIQVPKININRFVKYEKSN